MHLDRRGRTMVVALRPSFSLQLLSYAVVGLVTVALASDTQYAAATTDGATSSSPYYHTNHGNLSPPPVPRMRPIFGSYHRGGVPEDAGSTIDNNLKMMASDGMIELLVEGVQNNLMANDDSGYNTPAGAVPDDEGVPPPVRKSKLVSPAPPPLPQRMHRGYGAPVPVKDQLENQGATLAALKAHNLYEPPLPRRPRLQQPQRRPTAQSHRREEISVGPASMRGGDVGPTIPVSQQHAPGGFQNPSEKTDMASLTRKKPSLEKMIPPKPPMPELPQMFLPPPLPPIPTPGCLLCMGAAGMAAGLFKVLPDQGVIDQAVKQFEQTLMIDPTHVLPNLWNAEVKSKVQDLTPPICGDHIIDPSEICRRAKICQPMWPEDTEAWVKGQEKLIAYEMFDGTSEADNNRRYEERKMCPDSQLDPKNAKKLAKQMKRKMDREARRARRAEARKKLMEKKNAKLGKGPAPPSPVG